MVVKILRFWLSLVNNITANKIDSKIEISIGVKDMSFAGLAGLIFLHHKIIKWFCRLSANNCKRQFKPLKTKRENI